MTTTGQPVSTRVINTGLNPDAQRGVVQVLTRLLADEYVLYTKTRNYHWNVVGPHFPDFHRLFEAQYEELDSVIDETAERIRALGGWALGTLAEFSELARLAEHPGQYPGAQTMVSNLFRDHEAVIRTLREDLETCASDYQDAGTSNFLTDLMERHEKVAWTLRAVLEGQSL